MRNRSTPGPRRSGTGEGLEEQVLYESFSGNGMLCNPEAIFRRLLATPDLQHLRHVWALDDLAKHADVVAELADDPRVRLVERRSEAYVREARRSRYLVNNATFPPEVGKVEGQVWVNTWHGVPLKRMGYDVEDGADAMRNVLRNMVSCDFLLSSGPWMTDRMYRQAFRLQGIFRGTVVEEGQPRTDLQRATALDPGPVLAALSDAGVEVGARRVVLLAPTFRGTLRTTESDAAQLADLVDRLQSAVDDSEHVVLLKVHQASYDEVARSGRGRHVLVPNDVPTNALLGITDVLVTDYSSLLFDYLPTGGPILHHVSDLDDYTARRGLYLEPSELFGPVSRTDEELVAHLRAATAEEWRPDDRRRRAIATYAPHDDGGVTDRVVDLVFRGSSGGTAAEGHRTAVDLAPTRPSLLVHLGSLPPGSATTAALDLLRHLDHDRLDVSVVHDHPRGRDAARRLIDERCRRFAGAGRAPGTAPGDQRPVPGAERWRSEWRRLFGDARFDHGIDLLGRDPAVPRLLRHGAVERRSAWLDEQLTGARGAETPERLRKAAAAYRHFDDLVSASQELSRRHAQALSGLVEDATFTWAGTPVDAERVLRAAGLERGGPPTRRPPRSDGGSVLVTAGGLTPARAHARVLRAFARVLPRAVGTRLVVAGTGPLEGELQQLAARLGVQEAVTFAGRVDRCAALAAADCLVLAATQEARPTVVLEARVLGLPVVTTRFPTLGQALPATAGVVVDATDEALADGMLRYLDGDVGAAPFDVEAHNAEAMRQVYAAIGLAP